MGLKYSLCSPNIVSFFNPIHLGPRMSKPEPIAVSMKDAVAMTAISRSRLYEHMKEGRLAVVKNGSRTLIPVAELKRLMNVNTKRLGGR